MKVEVVDRRSMRSWWPSREIVGRLERLCAPAGRDEWCVGWVLADDQALADLNWRYRRLRGVTDVLSFSYLEKSGAGPPQLAAGEGYAHCDFWLDSFSEEVNATVGEIVLAPAFVADRCQEHGWPWEEELALLTVHGVLHVLGWEHGAAAANEAMQAREAELLARVGIQHPLLRRGMTD